MVDWVGLVIPVAYLSLLIGSLATFSSLYRKRKAGKLSLSYLNAIRRAGRCRPERKLTGKQQSLPPSNLGLDLIHSETFIYLSFTLNRNLAKKKPPPSPTASSKRRCFNEPRLTSSAFLQYVVLSRL